MVKVIPQTVKGKELGGSAEDAMWMGFGGRA
jgi:hypothetical protein